MCICVKQTWNFETLTASYWVALVILLDKLLEAIIITHLYNIDLVDTQLFEIVRANMYLALAPKNTAPTFAPSLRSSLSLMLVRLKITCTVKW